MNPQVPNELISAYFDGEASSEERAAVESLLDGSTATRRELDEIAQLSALLHSFPRESAPAELVANVRRQTDQLPLVAQAAPVVFARSRRREWTAAALGAVVTAAALMLMVNLTDRNGSRRADNATVSPSFRSPMTPAEAESIVSTGGQPRFGMKSGDESDYDAVTAATVPPPSSATAIAGPTASMKKADAFGANVASNDAAPKTILGVSDPLLEAQQFRNAVSNFAPLENTVLLNNGTITLNNGDFLNGLKAGQVHQFVLQAADPESNVAVVDLEVLDIERGADQVQVLLSRHSIRPRQSGQMSDRDKQNFEKLREQSKASPNEIIAVYTYGPGEKLAKALEDMQQHPDLFLSWSSQAPVQLPSNEELIGQAAAKDASVPTDQPAADGKSVASRRKEPATDDDMGGEAELVLNAVLARGNYANTAGFGGISDSNTASGPQEQAGNAKQVGRAFGDPAGRNRFPDPVSKAQSTVSRNAQSAAAAPAPALSPTAGAKAGAGGEQKLDVNAKKELAQQSGYRVVRLQNDAPVSAAEPALPLAQPQGQNLDRAQNMNRRLTANLAMQQADVNTYNRVDANQAVKVLFVLHPSQAPAAAPASKPNP